MTSQESEQQSDRYWTDDLPVCPLSGVGFSTNQVYRPDGLRREEKEFEDRSFHFKGDCGDNEVYLYGICDGHHSSKVSNLAAQKLPAEILLAPLNRKSTDQEIVDVLNQAFVSVEKESCKLIDDALAQKCELLSALPDGLTPYEQMQQYPDIAKKLRAVETEIVGGTAALVALVFNNKLYVANIGCSRALLCRRNERGELVVQQLNADHNLFNQSEVDRLSKLGLDPVKLRESGRLIGLEYTRSIGDMKLKRGFKDIEILSAATSEPLIAVPDVIAGVPLDDSVCFFALLSTGLHRTLVDSMGIPPSISSDTIINGQIINMITQQMAAQTTLNSVAQAVVDQVVRRHHDAYMTNVGKNICTKRDDITLIVRNVRCTLPHSSTSIQQGGQQWGAVAPLSINIPLPAASGINDSASPSDDRAFFHAGSAEFPTLSSNASTTLDSSCDGRSFSQKQSASSGTTSGTASNLQLDEEGRIEAYIDFEEYFSGVKGLSEAQHVALLAELEPCGGYETIREEHEPGTNNTALTNTGAVA